MLKSTQILVVEDEGNIGMEIQSHLEDMGYTVMNVLPSAELALEFINTSPPDLVLMDIMLQGQMDGIEAAAHIRRRFHLPIIFLTAHADEHTLQRDKITDPFGYLVKPFDPRDLYVAIEMGLYKHTMEQKLRQSEEQLRLLVESSSDIVLIQNLNRQYLYCHGSQKYGISPEEVVGKYPSDVFSPEALENFAPHIEFVLAHQQPVTFETSVFWGNQSYWFNIHVYPMKNELGQMNSYAVIARNVTEIKRLKGMLPICAWCGKKVRDELGQWISLDQYITLHTDATVTHSICDDCLVSNHLGL